MTKNAQRCAFFITHKEKNLEKDFFHENDYKLLAIGNLQ